MEIEDYSKKVSHNLYIKGKIYYVKEEDWETSHALGIDSSFE
jgi:hypothetical protein